MLRSWRFVPLVIVLAIIGLGFLVFGIQGGCTTTTKTNADGSSTKTTTMSDEGLGVMHDTAAVAGSLAYVLVPEARVPLAGICALTGQSDVAGAQASLKSLIGEVWDKASEANQWAVAVTINALVSQVDLDKLTSKSNEEALRIINAFITGICSGVGSATSTQQTMRAPKVIEIRYAMVAPPVPWAVALRGFGRA